MAAWPHGRVVGRVVGRCAPASATVSVWRVTC